MANPFSRKASLGTSLEDRPRHKRMAKDIYFPLSSKLAGFGKVVLKVFQEVV